MGGLLQGAAVKRLFDFLGAFFALVLLSPVILTVAAVAGMRFDTPIIFRQMRPGLNGKPFFIYKFRTMTDERNEKGILLPDGVRLTEFGRFLRTASMDELPELWNVLRGDMSLVGPRPLLMQYLDRYTPEQARRHEVRPGITGWAQVNGRNAITWEEKFELDLWYVDNRSFGLDMKIIWMTLWKILKREGITQPGHATAEEFMGTGQKSEVGGQMSEVGGRRPEVGGNRPC